MAYNPKEVGVDKSVPWQRARAAFPVRVDGPGFRIQAGLLLPATTRSAQGRFDDTDIVHVLSEGFGLQLPPAGRSRFVPGASVASLLLAPDTGQDRGLRSGDKVRGWQLSAVGVRASQHAGGGFEVRNQPLSIIAVLISL